MDQQSRTFSPVVFAVIDEFIPICQKLAEGRGKYAISVSGSLGKGTWDGQSDIDFRLFHEKDLPWLDTHPELWQDYNAAIQRWGAQGVRIDGVWCRKIDQIDAMLNRWLEGKVEPPDYLWTIWGYHLLTDLHNQFVIEDKYNVIADWKAKLRAYPPRLKQAILEKHLGSLRYWRQDYHYAHKVERQDIVFLAGLSAQLVHDIMQVLFALNEIYYAGDGNNLGFAARFAIKPVDFDRRIRAALYPLPGPDQFRMQRDVLFGLIDEVEALIGTPK
jgi:hypothetical protein